MKRALIIAVALVGMFSSALAQDTIATVTDAQGNIVKLTKLSTAHLSFELLDRVIHIDLAQIRSVRSLGISNQFEVTLVSGQTIKARLDSREDSDNSIEGEWELGKYAVKLSKVRQIAIQSTKTLALGEWNPPAGFVADVNGSILYNVQYEFWYHACNDVWIPCKSYTAKRKMDWLPVTKGSAVYFIPIDNIGQVTPSEVALLNGTTVQSQLYLNCTVLLSSKRSRVLFPATRTLCKTLSDDPSQFKAHGGD